MVRKKIAIIHPWMPQYRVGFFEQLKSNLARSGIELEVYYGDPDDAWKLRGDQSPLAGSHHLPTFQMKILGTTLMSKSLKPIGDISRFELVIVEHALRNLELYRLLLRRVPIAFWGHGRTYTQPSGVFLEWIKFKLAKLGLGFFTYTDSGERHLTTRGMDSKMVYSVQNSIDTTSLRSALETISSEAEEKFRKSHGLTLGHTALFLGALDESKKLPFLLRSLSLNAIGDPKFRLLIVGSGPVEPDLNEFISTNSWAQRLPGKFGLEKALILRCADVLVIPGRAGLVVVDSFAAGVPIVTTTDPYHPPEFDYLKHEYNALIVPENEESFSEAVLRALQPKVREQLSSKCLVSGGSVSIEKMALRFETGILEILANKAR